MIAVKMTNSFSICLRFGIFLVALYACMVGLFSHSNDNKPAPKGKLPLSN